MSDEEDVEAVELANGRMHPRHRRVIRWSLGSLAAVFLFWLFAAADYKISNLWTTVSSATSGEFITASLVSVIMGVLSAVFYSYIENKQAQAKLHEIYSSAPRDLLNDTVDFLRRKRDKGVMYDQTIEFVLGPSLCDDFLVMRVRYKYRKILTTKDLFFRIIRLKTADEELVFARNHAATDALYEISELFHQVVEVELRKKFNHQDIEDAFSFDYIKIDGASVSLDGVPGEPNSWYYRLPDTTDLRRAVAFDYAFRFAVPKSDIAFGVAERLTKGLTIEFMRDGALAGKIDHEAYEIMSAAQGSPVIEEDPPGTHRVSHEGWVIPKSGAVYHWWPL